MDWIILLVFVIIHPILGMIIKQRQSTVIGYVLAGRSRYPILVAASLVATVFGASAVLGTSGLAAKHGLTALAWLGSGVIGLGILTRLLDRIPWSTGMTLPDLISGSGDKRVGKMAALIIVPAWVAILAAQYAAIGRVVGMFTGGSPELMIVVAGFSVAAYVLIAGQGGVLKTDAMQLWLMLVLMLGLAILVFRNNPVFDPGAFTPLPAYKLTEIALAVGVPFLIGPDIYSRLLTLPDNADRKKALLYAIIGIAIVAVMITLLGMGSRLLTGNTGEGTLLKLAITNGGQMFGVFTGLALLAAILSSADTILLSSASILGIDLFGRKSKAAVMVSVVVISVASLMLALWLGSIIKTLLLAYKIYTGGLAIPMVAALFFHKPLPFYTLTAAIICGSTISIFGGQIGIPFSMPLALIVSGIIAYLGYQKENHG